MGRPRKNMKHLPPRMQYKHGAYYHVFRIDNKTRWVRLSSDFADAFSQWADREKDKLKRGSTINHMIDAYIFQKLGGLAPKTQEERLRHANKLKKVFGNMLLDDLQPHHVAQYLDGREARVSANREITTLSAMYKFIIRHGWTRLNPTTGVVRNPEKTRERYIADEELALLMENASRRMKCVIEIAYLTSLRKSDILALRLNQLTAQGLSVRPAKTEGSSTIRMLYTLSPRLEKALNDAKALRRKVGSVFLFTNRNGTPLTTTGFNSEWRRLKMRVGLADIHFHDIRAKSLTDAKEKGGLEYAQALGGHASVATTEKYIKAKETTKVDALF